MNFFHVNLINDRINSLIGIKNTLISLKNPRFLSMQLILVFYKLANGRCFDIKVGKKNPSKKFPAKIYGTKYFIISIILN